MRSLFVNIILWLLLIFISNNQVYTQNDSISAKLVNISKVDVCGGANDKEVIFYIDLGRIYPSDSLIGYNFEVKYDSTKLRFHTSLFGNTLSEFFEIKEVSFIHKGLILGYGANISYKPVYGERPLVAVLGDYIGECADTTTLVFSYIEFNDEFKKIIKSYENVTIRAEVKEVADRILQCGFESPIFSGPIDSLFEIKIKLKSNPVYRIWKQNFWIEGITAENFEIKEIYSLSGKMRINEIVRQGDKILLKTEINSFISEEEMIGLNIKGKNVSSNVLRIYPEWTDSCNCISNYLGDSCEILIKDTVQTGIKEETWGGIKVFQIYNGIAIESPKDELVAIKLIDIMGRELINKRLESTYGVQIDLSNVNAKIMVLKVNTKTQEKIIKLINIK